MSNYKLNSIWNLYFHEKNNSKKYADNTIEIAKIETIEDFWRLYNNLPKPLDIFSEYEFPNKILKSFKKSINAISYFRSSSFPQWEHETNKIGYEWSMRKQKNIQEANKLWLSLLLTILGESLLHSEYINGIRIVDCSQDTKIIYRYEVWVSKKIYKEFFENEIKKILNTPSYIRLIYRDHCSLKESEKIK